MPDPTPAALQGPELRGPERVFERIRDIPASCICSWSWGAPAYRWVLQSRKPGCPWHSAPVSWAAVVAAAR